MMGPEGRLYLFSSELERSAAFPDGPPEGIATAITGVGLIDAAAGTARAIDRKGASEIVFLGTCGAHRASGLEIGDIVLASDVSLGSGDVASGEMRVPSLMPSSIPADGRLTNLIAEGFAGRGIGTRRGRISCTLGITETDRLADVLYGFDRSDAENMEAFAVLRAAADIPVAVALGVTNIVGAGGGKGWLANFRAMMRRVAEIIDPGE
ncbi:MAG: hypothetical protein JWQ98_2776 [Chlorobi bacterium]|nr:hypothetical protein [Chlorobiota bacterium]